MRVTLVLGRDGMGGDASEADYDSWVSYVCDQIDGRAGFVVDVEERGARDVQSDEILGGTDEQRQTIDEVKQDLWRAWCEEGAPGATE